MIHKDLGYNLDQGIETASDSNSMGHVQEVIRPDADEPAHKGRNTPNAPNTKRRDSPRHPKASGHPKEETAGHPDRPRHTQEEQYTLINQTHTRGSKPPNKYTWKHLERDALRSPLLQMKFHSDTDTPRHTQAPTGRI